MACSYHHKITYSWGMNFRISSHLIILHVYMCIYMYILENLLLSCCQEKVLLLECIWYPVKLTGFGVQTQHLVILIRSYTFLTSPQHSKFLNVIFPPVGLRSSYASQHSQLGQDLRSAVSPDLHITPIYEGRTYYSPVYRSPNHGTVELQGSQTALYRTGSGGRPLSSVPFLISQVQEQRILLRWVSRQNELTLSIWMLDKQLQKQINKEENRSSFSTYLFVGFPGG